jgi:hypothetical protein
MGYVSSEQSRHFFLGSPDATIVALHSSLAEARAKEIHAIILL